MTIIEQIKAEIERLKSLAEQMDYQKAVGFNWALDDILSSISDLEKSVKPINQDELEKEIEEYFPESSFYTGFNYDDMQEIARHFAQWGAEHLKK